VSFGAVLRQPQRQQEALTETVPAPVGGVNARDALAAMPATDAIIADNWFCRPSYLEIRNGSQTWATGLPAAVETVMAYNGLTSRMLFCVSNGTLYDITTQGVTTSLVSGLSTSRLQHAMFNSGSGNVLVWADGIDIPQYYNGAAWANTTINGDGASAALLVHREQHDERLVLSESGVSGDAHEVPAGPTLQDGRDAHADGVVDHRQRRRHQ